MYVGPLVSKKALTARNNIILVGIGRKPCNQSHFALHVSASIANSKLGSRDFFDNRLMEKQALNQHVDTFEAILQKISLLEMLA